MKEGKIIVIVAPSGTGKSTLMSFIHKRFPNLKESVSTTTRPPREGEVHGTHYIFETVEKFEARIKTDDFLEWAKVHSNYYGTSKSFVSEEIAKGNDLIFDIDVQGADSFQEYFGAKANIIFIEPPSLKILKERLLGRATDSREVINERISNAQKELLRKNDYDYCVMNDKLEDAKKQLAEIISKILEGSI